MRNHNGFRVLDSLDDDWQEGGEFECEIVPWSVQEEEEEEEEDESSEGQQEEEKELLFGDELMRQDELQAPEKEVALQEVDRDLTQS